MTTCSEGFVINDLPFLFLSYHSAKFSGHRPCSSRDTAAKIFYVTLQDHVIKGSGGFMEGNSSLYIPVLPKLVAIVIMLMNI